MVKESVLVQEWMFYAWITGFTVRAVESADCPRNCSVDAFPSFNAFPAARVNTKFLLSPLAGWTATSPAAAAALQQMRQGKKRKKRKRKKNSCKVLLELFSSHLLVFHTAALIGCIASPAKKRKKELLAKEFSIYCVKIDESSHSIKIWMNKHLLLERYIHSPIYCIFI